MCYPLVYRIVLYCIVFIHLYGASHSMSLSEALPTTAILSIIDTTVLEFMDVRSARNEYAFKTV